MYHIEYINSSSMKHTLYEDSIDVLFQKDNNSNHQQILFTELFILVHVSKKKLFYESINYNYMILHNECYFLLKSW